MRPSALTIALLGTLILGGCQTLSGAGPTRTFADDSEFRSWFAYYYAEPKPDELRAAIDYMAANGYLTEFPDIAAVFLANVFKANPQRLAAWHAEFATLDPKTWNVLVIAFWLTDTPAAHELARQGIARAEPGHRPNLAVLLGKDPAELDLIAMDAQGPRHINMLWAAFSATGDTRYVKKVISYVHLYGAEERPDASSLGEAAIMTLATNALQHERVAAVSNAAKQDHPNPRTRALLGAMLDAIAQITAEGDLKVPSRPAH